MASEVKLNFTVEVGGDKDSPASIEIDARPAQDGGDNDIRLGKTSGFLAGEKIGFLIYFDPDKYQVNYVNSSIDCVSGGEIGSASTKLKTVDVKRIQETLNYETRGASAAVSKIIKPGSGNYTLQVVGHELDGKPILQGDKTTFKLPQPTTADVEIKDTDDDAVIQEKTKKLRTPHVYKIEYTSQAELWNLQIPIEETMIDSSGKPPWSISVVAYLKEKS